eukprot:7191973-Lingulodinium_polyedra.AAC.1
MAARRDKAAIRVHPLPEGMAGLAEGRVQYAVAHAGGARALHVVQVYGDSQGARSADSNLALVMEAVAWLRSLGDVPALL